MRQRLRKQGGRAQVWRLRVALTVGIVGVNVVGAAVVFVLAALVVPGPALDDTADVLIANLVLTGLYLGVSVPVGTLLGHRALRDVRRALIEQRELVEHEQRQVLRAPLALFGVQALLWLSAAALFSAVNATISVDLAAQVALVVSLGGVTTSAIVYLLAERILRGTAARALAVGVPDRLAVRSVTVRALLAWVLGTGVPLLGLGLVALSFLVGFDASARQLAITMLVLAAIGLAVGGLATFLAAKASSDPIRSVRRALRRVQEGELDVAVPVYDGTQIGQLQAGFNQMVEGLRERERLRDLFGRHVGEHVARSALERGAEMGGELREVAVLFVDVIGSTAIASERPADEVVELLNRFFAVVVDVIEHDGGWINKFEGDAALAIWGAPEPVPDRAERALCAARLLAGRLREAVPELPAAIGVSAGPAVAGNVGAAKRFEYTVIGDPVNEAARLTELAKALPGRVAASGRLLERAGAGEAERWESVREERLRGRSEATRVISPIQYA